MLLSTLRKLVFDPRVVPARRNRRAPPCTRPPTRKPCAELLEERLPPGELLLGGLLGSALWGPSLSATDSELWTPESVSPAPLSASLPAAGQSEGTATMSGRLAAESVLTSADDRAERPRREAGSAAAQLLAGANGDGPQSSAPALFDTDSLFASALRDPLQGSGAPSRDGAATFSEPVAGPAQGGGVAAGGGGAAASLNVAAGTSAGGSGVAQFAAPAGASSSLAPMNHDAGPAGVRSAAAAAAELGPTVHATFDLSASAGADFPSDRFTVDDANNLTGLRVNVPLPNPANPSDPINQDTQVLNTLDGFNLQPRLSIPFDGAIDPTSVKSSDVFLINLGDTVDHQEHGDHIVGMNQIVWDPATNSLHAESDQLLDQHTRYALIVTNGVLDTNGQPVQASEDFTRFLHELNFGQTQDSHLKEYRKELLDATAAAAQVGVPEPAIVTASVFTTESATATLEKIRDQIHAATPAAADLNLGPNGAPTVFSLNGVTGITFHQQTGTGADPSDFTTVQLTAGLSALKNVVPGAVGEIAFGSYQSPDYEVHPGEYIPSVATGPTGTPDVQGTNPIYFDLVLPSGTEPEHGWPVAIFGHGNTKDKNDNFLVAATLADHGIATIAINAVGSGFGSLGTLTVSQTGGSQVTFSAGGRGRDQDNNGKIASNEGLNAASPRTLLFDSDGIRQTAADLMQLVRVIEVGMDVPGSGSGHSDLDPSSIYYVGHSLGANYGTVFLAVEPDVHAAVLNAASSTSLANQELIGRGTLGTLLQSREPSLLNDLATVGPHGGISVFGGRIISPPFFDENMPLRNGITVPVILEDATTGVIVSPVTNTVPGAMAIQEFLDNAAWASQDGSPVAYAPHLRKNPLADVNGAPMLAKLVIYQVNYGDLAAPNPTTAAILRAGYLADRTTFYRHDLAYAEDPRIPKNPHPALISPNNTTLFGVVARAYQEQIATFFQSDGTNVIQPPVPLAFRQDLFEVSSIDQQTLTDRSRITLEGLNFIT